MRELPDGAEEFDAEKIAGSADPLFFILFLTALKRATVVMNFLSPSPRVRLVLTERAAVAIAVAVEVNIRYFLSCLSAVKY